MSGKSIYLRQVGLIQLMAQVGSFVPAEAATLGICDRIFTRVGAVDDLATGQSTFMVEMNETANILNHAKANSLVLLDEIGRGTSTFDGMAIAWSVAEYLAQQIKARGIFATHYHELNELATLLPNVANFQVTVKEMEDEIIVRLNSSKTIEEKEETYKKLLEKISTKQSVSDSIKKLNDQLKILEKMLVDKDLMLNGFNIHGTFWSTLGQEILTENNVLFSDTSNVNGLSWNSANADKVIIGEDGLYKLFFMGTTNTAAQFCLSVNDVPIDYTIQGTNKGAGQLTIRSILPLKKGDIITVKNHTSANGKVIISSDAGGKYKSLSVLLTIFKIAPLTKPVVDCSIKPVEQHDKYYENVVRVVLCGVKLKP
jgi:hypothetical protein